MWSPVTRNATLAIVCATLVGVAAAQAASRIVQWRMAQHYRQLAADKKHKRQSVRRATLREFQSTHSTPPWVALCGTVFDVSGDAFFDARAGGIYASWRGHDVAALLVYGGVIDGRPKDETEKALRDVELALCDVDAGTGDTAKRRRLILDEWYARFCSRYDVIGQISDLYTGDKWEALRDELTPTAVDGEAGQPRRRGKCPLGFGSSAVEQEEVQIADEDVGSIREIRFQGRRYDVRGSPLFEGAFAHFVGHDVTYALATESNDPNDLDVEPTREYSYEEQIRLEQYRRVFAKELRVISSPSDKKDEEPSTGTVVADLHSLIDQDAEVDEIQRALDNIQCDNLNAVCPRTTMTPLHKAVEKNRLDVVQLLVLAGADATIPAALYDDETPLQMAQRFEHTEIAKVLSDHTHP